MQKKQLMLVVFLGGKEGNLYAASLPFFLLLKTMDQHHH